MKKSKMSAEIARARLHLAIAANCRSSEATRTEGMKMLASEVGVYTNPATIEQDLMAYAAQIKQPMVPALLDWCLALSKGEFSLQLPKLPQFQLELV